MHACTHRTDLDLDVHDGGVDADLDIYVDDDADAQAHDGGVDADIDIDVDDDVDAAA